jgi:hypothetical protein
VNSTLIEKILSPLRTPFVIKEDGTSQTKLTNTGRVGFYVERQFGIVANNSREPDLGKWEIKSAQLNKKITIGTMPNSEFDNIYKNSVHNWSDSEPYKKMKNTLLIIYEKLQSRPEPKYIMQGWGACSLDLMNDNTKKILQEDYEFICNYIKQNSTSRDNLTTYLMTYGSISGTYLSLAYKGDGQNGYNYPAWSFQASFTKKLNHA